MSKEHSYQYVFSELIKITEKIDIAYYHRALPTKYIDGVNELWGEYTWKLCVNRFCGKSNLKNFKNHLNEVSVQIMDYIVERRLDLYKFYDFFLLRLEESKSKIERLQCSELSLAELIAGGTVKIIYTGYLPLDEHYDLLQLGLDVSPKDTTDDENDLNKVYDISKEYFDAILQKLDRLSLFLKHEINIRDSQEEAMKNQKGKKDLINLIRNGKLEELFKETEKSEEYAYDESIIQLSARYFILESDKNRDVINRDEYNLQISKLVTSLISAILKV